MELSIEVMKSSIQEVRADAKPSPFVGAVLVRPDGLVETAYRGELREGDHAEYTLIDRKCRSERLDGSLLFATLEPCAPGARHFPKLGCSERIVNARISKVYIGIEDPDPTVCRKGIKFLVDSGVEVEMYPQDLQQTIIEHNLLFLSAANERARLVEEDAEEVVLSKMESEEMRSDMSDLNEELLGEFVNKAELGCELGDVKCNKVLAKLGILAQDGTMYAPTGIGLLLFGTMPHLYYPGARIKATFIDAEGKEHIKDFDGPILKQPDAVLDWIKDKLDKWIDRSNAQRKEVYSYPVTVINELVKNAIVHRDYDIEGANIYVTVSSDSIVIKSPGGPVAPIKMRQIADFDAPSLSRNPKIMYVFDVMGLAEQRGFGFKTVRELPVNSRIPLPLVTVDEPYIVFTLPFTRDSSVYKEASELEIRTVEYLHLHESTSRKVLAQELGVDDKKMERVLKVLLAREQIERVGGGRSTVYRAMPPEV